MRKKLDPAQQRDADMLAHLPDTTIDTDDIPEAPAAAWREARRPGLSRAGTQPVTLRLDADIIAWFKDHAVDGRFQAEISRVLRRHVAEAEQPST